MKTGKLLLTLALWSLATAAAAQLFDPPLSPRLANYQIAAVLDPGKRLVQGTEKLSWKNASAEAVSELRLHLYPNAFRNSRSTFLKDADPKTLKKFGQDGWGYLELARVALASGTDLTASIEFISPDDGNPHDRTVVRVPLPKPVPPGGTVELLVDFATRLPQPPLARSGAKGDYFFFGQWFPKVGVYEAGRGWNCHQYHLHTEFYADFGVYDVELTVPKNYVVGGTGLESGRTDNPDGTATHVFHAEDVHDFVWTASPDFLEFSTREQDVDIRLLLHKSHRGQAERHLEAARLAVRTHQDRYGDYPYPNLTVVDPAPGAFASGGMEYPTLVTAGTFKGLPAGARMVEMVVIHEFGHNYWYGLVASNEFEHSWLDEGINTYSEIKIMRELYGGAGFADLPGLKVDNFAVRRYSYLVAPDRDPIRTNAWEYYDGLSYRANSYSRPALALLTLESLLGEAAMQQILRTYFERWKFKHPGTEDFVAVAEEVSGQDLGWFFDPLLYSNATLDYAVTVARSKKIPAPLGYDDALGNLAKPASAEASYETVVKLRRLGQMTFPVEIELEFENGEVIHESWDGKSYWREYRYEKPAKLKRAEVDPERKLALDLDWSNNTRTPREKEPADGGYLGLIRYLLHPEE